MQSSAERYGLSSLLPALYQNALPAIALTLTAAGGSRSRFGGAPLLPKGYVWPWYKPRAEELVPSLTRGFSLTSLVPQPAPRPLDFLLQVDLAELCGLAVPHPLPASGLLTFFFDVENQPWGYDPRDAGACCVCLVEDSNLVETRPPLPSKLPARSVRYWNATTLPHLGSSSYDRLDEKLELPDEYFDLSDEVEREGYPDESGLHRMFGHSANIQGDMQLEAQLVANGIYFGDPSGYVDPRTPELEKGAGDWVLLLQLDSEPSLKMLWGDSGMLYFWIHRDDLAAGKFERCRAILQCS